MKAQFRDLNILTGKVADYLESQQYFLLPAIEQYQKIWRRGSLLYGFKRLSAV